MAPWNRKRACSWASGTWALGLTRSCSGTWLGRAALTGKPGCRGEGTASAAKVLRIKTANPRIGQARRRFDRSPRSNCRDRRGYMRLLPCDLPIPFIPFPTRSHIRVGSFMQGVCQRTAEVRGRRSEVRSRRSEVGCQTPNIEHRTWNIERSTFNVQHSTIQQSSYPFAIGAR